MISFRFHLVSIVAVFLALAIGVLVGTTVVNQGVIDDLNRRVEDAASRADELRRQVDELQSDLRGWEAFGAAVEPILLQGRLLGREVVIVTQEGVEPSEVDGVRRALEEAGASVVATIVATERMALEDADSLDQLGELVGLASANPAVVSQRAARVLATRLAGGPPSPETPAADPLEELVEAGFLALQGGPAGETGGNDQAVVILSGGENEPVVAPEAFLRPLASALAHSFKPVVAAESRETVYEFVPLVRDDSTLDGRLVTVDNADTIPGRIAVVLGLRDLLVGPGNGGHYGVKDGAVALMPEP